LAYYFYSAPVSDSSFQLEPYYYASIFLWSCAHFGLDKKTDNSHGWQSNTTDKPGILEVGLLRNSYPWYCLAIRGVEFVFSFRLWLWLKAALVNREPG